MIGLTNRYHSQNCDQKMCVVMHLAHSGVAGALIALHLPQDYILGIERKYLRED
jgi:hypothetical protein